MEKEKKPLTSPLTLPIEVKINKEEKDVTPTVSDTLPPLISSTEQLDTWAQLDSVQSQLAAALSANTQPHLASPENLTSKPTTIIRKGSNQSQQATKLDANLQKEHLTQKIREGNRERKKRWRENNQERNLDNDLRCRITKRSHKLFGAEDSEIKQQWIQEEFKTRKEKRKERERKKGGIDREKKPVGDLARLSDVDHLCSSRAIMGNISNTSLDAQQISKPAFPVQFAELLQLLQNTEQPDAAAILASTLQENKDTNELSKEAVMTLMQLNAGWKQ